MMGFDFKQFHKDAPLPSANGAAVAEAPGPQVGASTPAGIVAKVLTQRMALGEVAAAVQLPAELVTMGLDLLVGMGLAVDYGGGEFGPAGAAEPQSRPAPPVVTQPTPPVTLPAPPVTAPADGAQALLLEQVQALLAQNAELANAVRHLQGERATLQVQKDPDEPPEFPGEVWRGYIAGKLRVVIEDQRKAPKRKNALPGLRIVTPYRPTKKDPSDYNGTHAGDWVAPFSYAPFNTQPTVAAREDWLAEWIEVLQQLHRIAVDKVAQKA